jgi:hypothetical protein
MIGPNKDINKVETKGPNLLYRYETGWNQLNASAVQTGPPWVSIDQIRHPGAPSESSHDLTHLTPSSSCQLSSEHFWGVKLYVRSFTTVPSTALNSEKRFFRSADIEVRTICIQFSFSATRPSGPTDLLGGPGPGPRAYHHRTVLIHLVLHCLFFSLQE